MKTSTEKMAEAITEMTYSEAMRVAASFSQWTATDDEGNDLDHPTVDPDLMAKLLADWANDNLPTDNTDH